MEANEIFDSLNPEQDEVVNDIYGPSICIAGPGAGKTMCIVARTVNMINNGIAPESIILFTFTKKAATELKNRIEKALGKACNGIMIGTYHSVCGRLLRKYASYIGYDHNFTIYDEDDKLSVIKTIIQKIDNDIEPKEAAKMVSKYKMLLYTPEMAEQKANVYKLKLMAQIYREYEKAIKKSNAMDFDDLIYNMVKLMEKHKEVQQEINSQYRFVVAETSAGIAVTQC